MLVYAEKEKQDGNLAPDLGIGRAAPMIMPDTTTGYPATETGGEVESNGHPPANGRVSKMGIPTKLVRHFRPLGKEPFTYLPFGFSSPS
ncbi:MAG: hypothetical protein AAAB35_14215 [Phyllobacterium sp.]|uniref:hypothetical protein n=1 Tax=Phyllobacterium sp. TaxID=1871046 RepID=UPI0013AF0480